MPTGYSINDEGEDIFEMLHQVTTINTISFEVIF